MKTRTFLGLLVLAAVAIQQAFAAPTGSFTLKGTVTRVVDGDTVDVRLASGKRERVRLIGVDSPEPGGCFASPSTQRVRQLALSKPVVLHGDGTQATRDRYGRLLAYVWIPGGRDLGYQLVAGGFAKVYVFSTAFERLSAYRRAEAGAKSAPSGLWRSCGARPVPVAPTPPPGQGCHPSYSPCLPVTEDLDCADVRALGVAPVRVLGSDPYRLDADDDDLGCE